MHPAFAALVSSSSSIVGPIHLPNAGPNRFDDGDTRAYAESFVPCGWELWGNTAQRRTETGHATIEFWVIRCDFAERMTEMRCLLNKKTSNGPRASW